MPKKNDGLDSVQPKSEGDVTSEPVKPAAKKPVVKKPAEKPVVVETNNEVPSETKPDETPVVASTVAQPAGPRFDKAKVKSWSIKIAAVLVVVLAVVVLVFGVMIYVYKSEDSSTKFVANIVPYPVEQVNGRLVSYSDYLFEIDANKRAYQNNAKLNNQPAVDYASADGKKLAAQIKTHALDKLKSDAVIAQLAHDNKVKLTDKDVDSLLSDLYKRYGGKATLLKTLKSIYGWDIGDLKRVVSKQLLAQKVQEKITTDPALQAQAKTKAQDVLNKVKAGGDFAELAKKNSQASDASTGGDMGSVQKGQLPEDIQKAIDALQPGQTSDLVKTSYGYEIIMVVDKTGDSTHAQHIVINTVDFNTYLQGKVDKAKVKTLLKV